MMSACALQEEFFCTNVSPPHHGGAVPAPLPSGEPKWRGNYSEGSDYPVTSIVWNFYFIYTFAQDVVLKIFLFDKNVATQIVLI